MKHSLQGQWVALSLLAMVSTGVVADAPTSDFLPSTPKLEPVKGVEGSYGWDNPKQDVSAYDKLMIENVQIFLAPDSPYKGIDGQQMQMISETMRAVMTANLEPAYPVVSQPGPGVMRMSLAITNLKITKKRKNLINYTPVGLVVGGLRQLADALSNISLEGAMVEADIVDTQSDERIAVRIATKPFAQANVSENEMSWSSLEAAFEFYAKEVRSGLDRAHGKK